MLNEEKNWRFEEMGDEIRMRKDHPISQGLTFSVNRLQLPPYDQTSPRRSPPFGAGWLGDVLKELEQIDEEVTEEECPPVSNLAKNEARRLLFATGNFAVQPTVYSSIDGGIEIYFKSPTMPSAVLVLIENGGNAACYTSIHEKTERQIYKDSSELPDEFLKTRLRLLGGLPLLQKLGD